MKFDMIEFIWDNVGVKFRKNQDPRDPPPGGNTGTIDEMHRAEENIGYRNIRSVDNEAMTNTINSVDYNVVKSGLKKDLSVYNIANVEVKKKFTLKKQKDGTVTNIDTLKMD
ncbi:unnamed protein product [Diamesa serratosioi]